MNKAISFERLACEFDNILPSVEYTALLLYFRHKLFSSKLGVVMVNPVGGSGPADGGGNRVPPVNPTTPAKNPPERSPDWGANTTGDEGGTPSLDTSGNVNSGSTDVSETKAPGIKNLQEAFDVITRYQRGLEDTSLREVPLSLESYVEIGNACSLELQRDMESISPSSSFYLTSLENYNASLARLYSAILYISSNKHNPTE